MASYKAFVISGLFLVTLTLTVQSIPIHKAKQIIQLHSKHNKQTNELETSTSTTTISSPTTTTDKNDHKKKRYIDDDDQLDVFDNSESDEINSNKKFHKNNKINHVLHTKVQETSAKIHDNADKPVDTDDSKVFSDIKMTPNELTDVVRRRRDVKLIDESNRRRKRALSPYDFYNADSLYDSYGDLVERPSRSFAPLYWYPSNYERSLRSVLVPSYYQSSEWPSLYSTSIDDDDDDDTDDDEIPIYNDENDYESNRYPILLPASNNPFDNLQLQQEYNNDDLPIDEDFDENNDDDGEYRSFYERQNPYYSRYEPYDTYF